MLYRYVVPNLYPCTSTAHFNKSFPFYSKRKMCKTSFLCFFAVIFCFLNTAGGAPWDTGFMADRQHALLHDPAPTQPTFNLMPPEPDMVGADWT